jgi:hypothetical protein
MLPFRNVATSALHPLGLPLVLLVGVACVCMPCVRRSAPCILYFLPDVQLGSTSLQPLDSYKL